MLNARAKVPRPTRPRPQCRSAFPTPVHPQVRWILVTRAVRSAVPWLVALLSGLARELRDFVPCLHLELSHVAWAGCR